MADLDYDRQFFLANFPEQKPPVFIYKYKGKKYTFESIEEANKWAKAKGFKLTTAPSGSKTK